MQQIGNMTLNLSSNINNFFLEKGNECEVFVEDIYKEVLNDASTNLFYSSFAIIMCFVAYMILEVYKKYKVNKLKENSDFDKMIALDERVEFLKRCLVLIMFMVGARIFQIALWSL